MLAVVPLDEPSREGAARACDAALVAAREALANLDTLNAARAEDGKPPIAFGIGLHLGGVMYGNIGTGDRLDFTVIGPAVNMAARLASLCGKLDEPVVVSEYFQVASTAPLDDLGTHALKGVGDEEQVFRPAAKSAEMAS
jgi:adenylate cyclase